MFVGTMPRNILFLANLRIFPQLPWAVPAVAVYMWFFWQYLSAEGERRRSLRANPVPGWLWCWALAAGALAIVALVLALRLANRFVMLPAQGIPDLGNASRVTIFGLLAMGAPVAGIIEESAFRGYMQGPLEERFGLGVAILITGTMFAVAHLDFTPILWPYYVAVAAIYGLVTYLTRSILPSMVLHTAGNLYSNFDLYLYGQAEWQTSAGQGLEAGTPVWISVTWLATVTGLALGAFLILARMRIIRHIELVDRTALSL